MHDKVKILKKKVAYPKYIIQNILEETYPPLNWLEFFETPPKILLNVDQTLTPD